MLTLEKYGLYRCVIHERIKCYLRMFFRVYYSPYMLYRVILESRVSRLSLKSSL